jgi:hypothetical protein
VCVPIRDGGTGAGPLVGGSGSSSSSNFFSSLLRVARRGEERVAEAEFCGGVELQGRRGRGGERTPAGLATSGGEGTRAGQLVPAVSHGGWSGRAWQWRGRGRRPETAGMAPDSSSELKEGGKGDWMTGLEGLRPAATAIQFGRFFCASNWAWSSLREMGPVRDGGLDRWWCWFGRLGTGGSGLEAGCGGGGSRSEEGKNTWHVLQLRIRTERKRDATWPNKMSGIGP